GTPRIRPRRFPRGFVVAEFAVVEGVAGRSLRAFHRTFGHLIRGRLRLIGTHFLRGIRVGRAFSTGLVVLAVLIVIVVVVLVGFRVAFIAKLERRQEVMHRVAEFGL